MPARRAGRVRPIEATSVSAQVPISAPSITATPAGSDSRPCPASVITMPSIADDDWMITVAMAPVAIPAAAARARSSTA